MPNPNPALRALPSRFAGKAEQRAAVATAARGWIGTPYHHAADVIGPRGGVDCAMLLVRVYCDLGLVEPFDPRPYTRDWMLHRNEEKYLGFLLARARVVERPGLGDVILFRVGRCFAHGGIVNKTEPLTMIHAYSPIGCVVEDEVERCAMALRPRTFASYWEPVSADDGRAPCATGAAAGA